VQQAVFEFVSGCVVKQGRIEFALFGPQRIELGLDHGAVNVEVVAFLDLGFAIVLGDAVFAVTRPHRQALLVAGKQPFTHGAAAGGLHGLAQLADGGFECAAVVFFLVGLSVTFEATALVDVEKCAGKLFGQQGLVEALGAQGKRVGFFERFAGGFVLREKPVPQQRGHHAVFAFEQAVTATAHGPRLAAADGQR
jgi:hypothetical protein